MTPEELRLLAERWLPTSVYRRRKVIFRAPLNSFHIEPERAFVAQLGGPDILM
jgi:asparagine synthase (glutamine-hydrolysing)